MLFYNEQFDRLNDSQKLEIFFYSNTFFRKGSNKECCYKTTPITFKILSKKWLFVLRHLKRSLYHFLKYVGNNIFGQRFQQY